MSDDFVLVPKEPTEEIIDSVRYMITGIDLHSGRRTIGNFRTHCAHSGVDFSCWPDWATNGEHDDEHLTKAGIAILFYHTFLAASPPAAQPSNQLCPNCEEYTLKITNSGLSPTELQNELGAAFETMKHAIEHMDTEHLDAARSALTWSLDRADKLGIGKQPSPALSGKLRAKAICFEKFFAPPKDWEVWQFSVIKLMREAADALEAMKQD